MIRDLLNPGTYPKNVDFALLFLRIAVGVLMLTHGIGKMAPLFSSDPIQFSDPIGIGAANSLFLAVFAEVCCSILLILGLGTRLAAGTLLITMLVAALIHHTDDPFRKQELPLLYASIFVVIVIVGSGKFSIDNWLFNKIKNK